MWRCTSTLSYLRRQINAWGQLCTSGCFMLGDSAPLIPFGIATIWMLWRRENPATLSGTERRPSDLKARHLVNIVRYPDGGSILLSLKRPYISADYTVSIQEDGCFVVIAVTTSKPPISMYHFCVRGRAMSRIPILHSELYFALCCNEGHRAD